MDEEYTAGYREPCAQCAEVNWGISDEGRFYCRSCHNVIERTREAELLPFQQGTSRVTTINKGPRTKKEGTGYTWTACEGFQFILKNQADALLRLGVSPHFKDEVLCQLWRLFLQKSQQAYCWNQTTSFKFRPKGLESDSDSAAESIAWTTDGESNPPSTAGSDAETFSDWTSSECLTDTVARRRRCRSPMTMRKTLALIHLALVWSHEELTLSNLLRLVNGGIVPYINAFEQLPEEMKLFGSEARVFSTETIPSYSSVYKEAQDLLVFLDLPAPPPVGPRSLVHPTRLSLCYLMDANLPDDLHRWVCRLMERVGVADETPGPGSHRVLPRYDLQTAAAIIVTMKLMFGLDDRTEWGLSNAVGRQDPSENLFSFRRWFRVVQTALSQAQENMDQDLSRKQWKPKNPIIAHRKYKSLTLKRKRISEQLQATFEKLSSCPAGVQDVPPSSFRFCWGDEDGSDGPSLHHLKLDQVLTRRTDVLTPLNSSYWHTVLQPCRLRRCSARCRFQELQPTLPRSFCWLLLLFSFLLDVEPWSLFKEVLKVERQLLDPPPDRARSGRGGPRGGPAKRRREAEEVKRSRVELH